MYNLTKNNYHQKPKNNTIYTPSEVSQFIFELLKDQDKISKKEQIIIVDPCAGQGSLLAPWEKAGYLTFSIDNDENSTANQIEDFFEADIPEVITAHYNLVLCNPPFNGYGSKLASEVWLDQIIKLFGKEIPIVLFVPMGFRLNSKKNGKRWNKFINQIYPPISSIISLPRDIFTGVEFHSEILIFNLPNLQPHYFFNLTSKIEQRTPI